MILDAFNLTGKVAIVTGARTGLGQGIAFGLAEAGTDIVGVDVNHLGETQKGIEERGRKFLGIEKDLSNIRVINDIIDQTIQEFKRIDILVNNAGIIRRTDAIEFSEKDWDDVMNVNLKTVFFFSQGVAKQFLKQKTDGKIINIASMLSFQGGIRVPSYTASKSGVMGITRLMANEWAKYNININAIAPGRTRYLAYTQNLMMVVVEFNDGPTSEPDPPHSHPNEQVSYVASGEINLFMENKLTRLGPGDMFTVPPNIPHSVQLLTEQVMLVDSFTPVREDFLK